MEVLKDMVVFVVYALLAYVTYRGAFGVTDPIMRWAFRIGFLVAVVFYTLILLGIGVI